MKKIFVLVIAMLMAAPAFGQSTRAKKRACAMRYADGFEACLEECREGPKREMDSCFKECNDALDKLVDRCMAGED